jgi:hypothetical protein
MPVCAMTDSGQPRLQPPEQTTPRGYATGIPWLLRPRASPEVTYRLVHCAAAAIRLGALSRRHALREDFEHALLSPRASSSACTSDPMTAEMVLGHRLSGVMGTYERADFFDNKSDALARFATHLLSVVGEKVVQLRPVSA